MWHFYSPNIIYGEGALNFIENLKGEKCFIVTDKIIEELGYLKILTDKLDTYKKKYSIFTEVVPDPHEEDVLKGKKRCNEYEPDLLIALGGGSVIDSAKCIWAMYEYPEYQIDNINPFDAQLYDFANKAKLIAIPTTSGTGSEATWAAIISRLQDNAWRKMSLPHMSLVPTFAILDPIFPEGMPQKLTVNTAFDALAHAMEGYISSWRNEFSNALAVKAIELIFKYLPIVYNEGSNKEARDFLHQAATMAGLAFSNSQIHLGHAMGHSFSAIFPIPHGQIVGLFIKYITQYCLNNPIEPNEAIEIYSDIAKKLGWAKWEDKPKKAAYCVIEKIKELQDQTKFITNIKDLGIDREKFNKNLDQMIGLCYQDPSSVMAPRTPNMEEFAKLYNYAYEGKDVDF
ncbi:MAG: iron-containing alcohol dehydrogenase [Candidatus Lokiarchaeota archaeon]|nr:iron-containing alcohol dehydrogenase [Candidatus Lokiarchaeota archaeon]